MITIHEISSPASDPETLTHLLTLSNSIFNPETPESQLAPHHRREVWEQQLSLPNSKIFYATSHATASQPIGFFFTLPRTHAEIGYELLHIRIAAVSPESRGQGVFPLLMERAKAHARECGYGEMTVCTFPERFERMWRILLVSGWSVVADLETAETGDGVKKLLKIGL